MSESTAVGIAAVARAMAQQMRAEGGPADRAIQAGIDATMRAVTADRYNPVLREASPTVRVMGAVP
jgi:hypothetical protein